VKNLAGSPDHQAVLARMRAALAAWQKETKDLGRLPEAELRERMRPGGVWQQVAAPTGTLRVVGETVQVRLACATEGASIVYTEDAGPRPRWKLYTGELTVSMPIELRIKACRFGFLDSEEISLRPTR
jgi:uncharacterized sulfatase